MNTRINPIPCFLGALFLVLGCGGRPSVNPALQKALDFYIVYAPSRGHADELVSLDFGNLPVGLFGQCFITPEFGNTHSRKVVITKTPMEPIMLKTLVAHELGHCLHDRHHDDLRSPALMNTKMVDDPKWWEMNLAYEIERTLQK